MTSPAISVVLPTRDRKSFLRQALRSVLAQDLTDLEAVVVDDGSLDGCEDVVNQARDDRVRLVSHRSSQGVSEARNSGIEASRGDWLAFLDDDDLLAPGSLLAHLSALRSDAEATWSCGGLIHVDPALRVIGRSAAPDPKGVGAGLATRNVIPAPSCVVASRRAVDAAGRFDPDFSCFADWDLWIRLAPSARLISVQRPLAAYRFHGNNMSGEPDLWEAEGRRLKAKHGLSAAPYGGASQGRVFAWEFLRAGRPATAARGLLGIARHDRDWRALVLAAAITASPRLAMKLDAARANRQLPDDWRREAEEWLRPFRS